MPASGKDWGSPDLKCPYCGCADSKVIDTRPAEEDTSIRRRRECLSCKQRFTTFEVVEHVPLIVIKRDGSRQAFDRHKILNGLIRSCEKRPVPFQLLEDAARSVELQLLNRMEREVESRYIGELVMERLKEIDEVSYVRFASVYRQFKDLSSFMDELKVLLRDSKEQTISDSEEQE